MSSTGKYKIGRDEQGLTERERQVLDVFRRGATSLADVAAEVGVSKQRLTQLLNSLVLKGALARTESGYATVVPR